MGPCHQFRARRAIVGAKSWHPSRNTLSEFKLGTLDRLLIMVEWLHQKTNKTSCSLFKSRHDCRRITSLVNCSRGFLYVMINALINVLDLEQTTTSEECIKHNLKNIGLFKKNSWSKNENWDSSSIFLCLTIRFCPIVKGSKGNSRPLLLKRWANWLHTFLLQTGDSKNSWEPNLESSNHNFCLNR